MILSFEEDYIHRTVGSVTQNPENALTELIANAWDAGARNVLITIPEKENEKIIIEDDGIGMTAGEFSKRWMTLSYNRLKNQGINVEFPNGIDGITRKAYGRNGIGRHSIFCFSNSYHIDTWKDGKLLSCDVSLSSGDQPIKIDKFEEKSKEGHGTILSAFVHKNLPNVRNISQVLSARYLFDPEFVIKINGKAIDLSNHAGLQLEDEIKVDDIKLNIYVIESGKTAVKSIFHGIAFWVGKRLVGEPSWELCGKMIRDGRTQFAKQHTVIVSTNDMYDDVLPDWTGFKNNDRVTKVQEEVKKYIEQYIRIINTEKREDFKMELARENIDEIREMDRTSRDEISSFIDGLIEAEPEINYDVANLAINTFLNIQKSRSGKNLLEKLSKFSEEDVESLNAILDSWSIKDIQLTLDTIDKRIMVIEAIERLCSNKKTDELHTLHPLVAQARWLFGPEYDSEMYTFNKQLQTIIKDILKSQKYNELESPNRRPDLVIFEQSSFSVHSYEDWNNEKNLMEVKNVLIIELKKGGFEITRNEMKQATDYVEEIAHTNGISSAPKITAYVVGDKVSERISKDASAGSNLIYACTYMELVGTAKRRLFKLRERLNDRYEKMPIESIVEKVLQEPKQLEITIDNLNS